MKINTNIINYIRIFTFILYTCVDLVDLPYVYLLLFVYFVLFLIHRAVLYELYLHFTIDWRQPLALDNLELLVHQLDVWLIRYRRSVDIG